MKNSNVAKNYEELLKLVTSRAVEGMRKYSDIAQQAFSEGVHDKMYERQLWFEDDFHRPDGITSGKNVISHYRDNGKVRRMEIMDITRPAPSLTGSSIVPDDPTMFFRWINEGEWFDIFNWLSVGAPPFDKDQFYRAPIKILPAARDEVSKSKFIDRVGRYIEKGK